MRPAAWFPAAKRLNPAGLGIHSVLIALVSAVALASAPPARAQDQLQQQRYCLATQPIVALIIDVTTEYDNRDRELLLEAVGQIMGSLKGGERLIIRTITDTFATSDRLFDQCVPVCVPRQNSYFSGCSRGTIELDRRRMRSAANSAMRNRLQNFQARQNSDIVRTLAHIGRDVALSGRPNRIFIFSDLIENSDHLRGAQFFTEPNVQLIERLRRSGLIPAFDQSIVSVFGVGRSGLPGHPPLPVVRLEKLRDFWTRYFQAANAGSCTITEGLPRIN